MDHSFCWRVIQSYNLFCRYWTQDDKIIHLSALQGTCTLLGAGQPVCQIKPAMTTISENLLSDQLKELWELCKFSPPGTKLDHHA